jgi:glycosyltransferase involved in cell wall biosynthesis
MKILYVIHYPNFGGPHNRVLTLYNALLSENFELVVVIPDELGNAYQRLVDNKIEILKIKLHRARAIREPTYHIHYFASFFPEVLKLRRIIRDNNIKLVVVGGLINPHAAIAAFLGNVPLVWQILDVVTPLAMRVILFPFVFLFSNAVMCVGLEVARKHPGIVSLGKRLHLHMPPVDPDRFKPDSVRRAKARVSFRVDEQTFLIGTVGSILPLKGHEFLIQAIRIIRNAYTDFRVCILGQTIKAHSAYLDYLLEEIRSAGLVIGKDIDIIDPQDKVADLLQGFDCFVLSSISEAMPTVVLEAMATALPVIATSVGAIKEVVSDGETGMIVPPKDPNAIALAIRRLLCDKRLCRQMGLSGRLKVLRKFGLEQCTRAHVNAFRSAINRHTKGHNPIKN